MKENMHYEGVYDTVLPEDLADYKIEDSISGNTIYIFGAQHLSPEMKKILKIKE